MSLEPIRFHTQEELVFSFESIGSQIIILQVREEEVLDFISFLRTSFLLFSSPLFCDYLRFTYPGESILLYTIYQHKFSSHPRRPFQIYRE